MVRGLAAVLVFGMVATSARARADSAAVMSVGGSPEVHADEWDAATVAVSAELERRTYSVAAGAVRTRAQSPRDCVEDACVESERARLDVTVLATVSVFAALATPEVAGSVVVTLSTSAASYVGHADVATGGIEIAARRAVAAALDDLVRGGHPWLTLRGQPEGALVVIDDVERGVLPWEGALTAGQHHIEVRLTGYVPYSTARAITAGTPTVLDVALVREGAASSGPDVPWLVAGSASAAGGVGAIIAAIVGATTDSCSASCSAGVPTARSLTVSNDAGVAAWAVVGGVLVVLGAVALGVGFAGGSSARPVSLRPDGLTVSF